MFGQPLACRVGRGVFWLAAATLGNKENAGGGATRPSVGKAVKVRSGPVGSGKAVLVRREEVGRVKARRSRSVTVRLGAARLGEAVMV